MNGDDQELLAFAIQQLKRANAELWQPWDSTAPQVLYHYCDIHGMHGIFSSGHIWASDVLCLNDPAEVQYARELILGVLRSRTEIPETLWQPFSSADRLADAVVEWRVRVFCMCEVPDDLSQWRAYGKGGGGFAIGISRDSLLQLAIPDPSAPFALVRIMYEEARQLQQVSTLIDAASKIVEEVNLTGRARQKYWIELGIELLTFLCRFKAPAFAPEKEWRLLSILPVEPDQFRIAGSFVVPYVSLTLPKDAFCELYQGPTVNTEFALRSLRRFLNCTEFGHILPKQSAIRLRS